MKQHRRELEIMRRLEGKPGSLTPLLNVMNKPALYRTVKKLIGRRFVAQEEHGVYRLLPDGQRALDASRHPVEDSPARPRLPIPHLEFAPTSLHRSILELILCAVAVRSHGVRSSHLPAFVLAGPKLTFKSWTARAACLLAGVDPTRFVIPLMNETGRSMTTRRDHRGALTTLRQAMGEKVVGLDEWLRAKLEVRRLAQTYLHGERAVPDEDDQLDVIATPIVTMNPKKVKDAEVPLEDRLGLDDATLRRCIVTDVSAIAVPEKLLTEGDSLVEKLKTLGPVEIPRPKNEEFEPRARVKAALLELLDEPERLAGVDVVLVAQLVTGATAWLPDEDALSLVMHNYLSIIQTLGWVKANWRGSVEKALAQPEAGTQLDVHEEEEKAVLAPTNAYDYEAKLQALAEICGKLGLNPGQAEQRMKTVEAIDKLGVSADDVKLFVELLRREGLPPRESIAAVAAGARAWFDQAVALQRLTEEAKAARAEALEARREADRQSLRLSETKAVIDELLRSGTLGRYIWLADARIVDWLEKMFGDGDLRNFTVELNETGAIEHGAWWPQSFTIL